MGRVSPPGKPANFPPAAATALPGRCGKHLGHRPRHLAQVLRRRSRKQSQEAAQSPGEGRGRRRDPPPGRCPRAVGAPTGPLGAQAPVPAPLERAVGVLTVPGDRAVAFLRPAPCLCPRPWGTSRGLPASPHRPGLTSHFLPAQPASRKPRPGHPWAPHPHRSQTLPRGCSAQAWAVQVAGGQSCPRGSAQ